MIFLAAKRDALAIKALERGLVYDEDNPQIPLLLAETLLKQNKAEQALALVDRYIRRQPQGVEAYELLAKVLKALKPRGRDHAPARGGREARFQERPAPVRPGRPLSRDGPGREGRCPLQVAAQLAADARRPTGPWPRRCSSGRRPATC